MFKKFFLVIIPLVILSVAFFSLKKSFRHTMTSSEKKISNEEIHVIVNADKVIGNIALFYRGIGMGTFNDGVLLPYNRSFFNLVVETNEENSFIEYVNMKSIFRDPPERWGSDDGAHVVQRDRSGKITYHWQIVDQVLDKLMQDKIKPIISFTFMPKDLASDPRRINPWHKAIVSPPKVFDEWRELIFQTVTHLKDRYGPSVIETWYFEVWNEPDLYEYFWIKHPDKKGNTKQSDSESYCKLYDYTVDGALAAYPEIKIGGPGLAGDRRFLRAFLNHCYGEENYVNGNTGTRVDFISRHHYGEIEERIIPQYTEFIKEVKSISGEAFQNLEILITETGPSAQPKPWLNDRYVAAWIVKEYDAFLALSDQNGSDYLPDMMCFWSKPVASIFGKQFGLVTALGNKHNPSAESIVKRPAFNGLQAVNCLKGQRIEYSGTNFGDPIHGIASRDGDGITLVLYHLFENDYFNENAERNTINISFLGCDHPEYSIACYVIDQNHSNGFRQWQMMGSPLNPDPEKLKILQSRDDLELIEPVSKVQVRNGEFSKKIVMQTNSVALIKLSLPDDRVPPQKPSDLKTMVNADERTVRLSWTPPAPASDGDRAASYVVRRNGKIISRQFGSDFEDSGLEDDAQYHYSIQSVDQVGNVSESAVDRNIEMPKDTQAPEIVRVNVPNEETVIVYFNEPLDSSSANDSNHYSIDRQIRVENATYDPHTNSTILSTSGHDKGSYVLTAVDIRDLARDANTIATINFPYRYAIDFADGFDQDTRTSYRWSFTGSASSHYESSEKKLILLTGEDSKLSLSHRLPRTDQGTFSFRFQPFAKYPDGGAITIFLKQDDKNYYKVNHTDGYGPGNVEKVVNGDVSERISFKDDYAQDRSYDISIQFAPQELGVQGFSEKLVLRTNPDPIDVRIFEIELVQQDATIDDVIFKGE